MRTWAWLLCASALAGGCNRDPVIVKQDAHTVIAGEAMERKSVVVVVMENELRLNDPTLSLNDQTLILADPGSSLQNGFDGRFKRSGAHDLYISPLGVALNASDVPPRQEAMIVIDADLGRRPADGKIPRALVEVAFTAGQCGAQKMRFFVPLERSPKGITALAELESAGTPRVTSSAPELSDFQYRVQVLDDIVAIRKREEEGRRQQEARRELDRKADELSRQADEVQMAMLRSIARGGDVPLSPSPPPSPVPAAASSAPPVIPRAWTRGMYPGIKIRPDGLVIRVDGDAPFTRVDVGANCTISGPGPTVARDANGSLGLAALGACLRKLRAERAHPGEHEIVVSPEDVPFAEALRVMQATYGEHGDLFSNVYLRW